MTKERFEDRYDTITDKISSLRSRIGQLEKERFQLRDKYLEDNARFKVNDIVMINIEGEWHPGYIKYRRVISLPSVSICYQIGKLKKDKTPHKAAILRHVLDEKYIKKLPPSSNPSNPPHSDHQGIE